MALPVVMVQIVKYRLVGQIISYLSKRLQTSSLFADDAATYRNNQCQERRRLDDRGQATVGGFCSASSAHVVMHQADLAVDSSYCRAK